MNNLTQEEHDFLCGGFLDKYKVVSFKWQLLRQTSLTAAMEMITNDTEFNLFAKLTNFNVNQFRSEVRQELMDKLNPPTFTFTVTCTISDRDCLKECLQEVRDSMEHDWDEEEHEEFDQRVSDDREAIEAILFDWRGLLADRIALYEPHELGLTCDVI